MVPIDDPMLYRSLPGLRSTIAGPDIMPDYVYLDYDADTLHGEYNNRAKVPDFASIVSDWQQRSTDAVNTASRAILDLPYGESQRQRLDLFLPEQETPPLHVFIHGGYWQAMDRDVFSFLCSPFNAAGIAFANLEYTLCPRTDLKGIIEEMQTALGWLYRNAGTYGFNRNNIQVSGHSAGGHLAAVLAATDWPALGEDLPATLITSAMPISGIYDLEPLRHIPIGDALDLHQDQIKPLSPVNMPVNTGTCMTITLGAHEGREFHRQAEILSESYRKQGRVIPIRSVATRNHFTILEELAAPGGQLFSMALRMIRMN